MVVMERQRGMGQKSLTFKVRFAPTIHHVGSIFDLEVGCAAPEGMRLGSRVTRRDLCPLLCFPGAEQEVATIIIKKKDDVGPS